MGISFMAENKPKLAKITSGIVTLTLLVAGMGLLARTYPGQPWPVWAKAKIGIWALVAILTPVLSKRLTQNRGLAFVGMLALLTLATCLAVLKPF